MPSKEIDIPVASNQANVADAKEFPTSQLMGGSLPPCVPGPSCAPPTCGSPPCRGCQPACAPQPCRVGKDA